jgi:hypothetical protein
LNNQVATNATPSRLHGAATMVTMLIVISISLVTYRIIEVRARQALRFAFSLKPRRPDKNSLSI